VTAAAGSGTLGKRRFSRALDEIIDDIARDLPG
jgi:hypothetical protein